MRHDAITDRAIRDWVGIRGLEKGRQYASSEDILDPIAQGDTLKARIQGTADRPYRLWVRVVRGQVQEADCSCPVGDGGRCKHVAALLMTFRADPDLFTEVEEADANLQARDKAELIALIKLMLRKAPELESLLAAPVPGGKKSKTPPNPDVYRKQAVAVLRSIPQWEEWGGEEAERELAAIVHTGQEFEQANDFATATAVFQGVCNALLDDGRELLPEACDLSNQLVEGLLRSLNREPAGNPRRESLLRSVFDLIVAFYIWAEGDEFDPLNELLLNVTKSERRTLTAWARQLQARGDEYSRQRQARLQIRIDADVMDDAGYLKVCREAGMTTEVVTKLFQLGREDEAVREVETALGTGQQHDVLHFAALLANHAQGAAAERLVRGVAAKSERWEKARLLEWLQKRFADRGDKAEVLKLANEIFDTHPALVRYRELRKLTPKAEWPARQKAILAQLRRDRDTDLVIDILLAEKDIDAALAQLRSGPASYKALAVAKAAEPTHPADAIEIYRKHAERQIEGRSRTSYQEACHTLTKVGELMTRTRQASAFQKYVAGLLTKYSTLRAFHDEVKKAKLVQDVPATAVRRKG